MPAILTLNKLNYNPIIQLYLGVYVFFSTYTLICKLIAVRSIQDAIALGQANDPVTSLSQISVPMVQLIPNKTFYYPWTLLTSTFAETNIFVFLVSLPSFYFALDFLCKSFDNNSLRLDRDFFVKNEINKFIWFNVVVTNIITVLNYIVVYLIIGKGNVEFLSQPINHGLLTIAMSFVVLLKQLKPEVEIKYLSIRLKDLPFIVYITSIVLSVLFQSLTPFFPISNNFLVSWYYLRFVQKDFSSIFEFTSFFPDFLRPVLSPIVNAITKVLELLNLIPNSDGMILPTTTSTLQITSEVLERRRLVALKVLEERIGE